MHASHNSTCVGVYWLAYCIGVLRVCTSGAYCMCVRLERLCKIRPHIHKCTFSTTVLALAFIGCGVLHVCTSAAGAFVCDTPTHIQMHFLYIAYVSEWASTRVSVASTLHPHIHKCMFCVLHMYASEWACTCVGGLHLCRRIAYR